MLEEEMEAILMERIRDKANTERYPRRLLRCFRAWPGLMRRLPQGWMFLLSQLDLIRH